MSNETEGPIVLEDWAPLSDSLHFHLGQYSYHRAKEIIRTQGAFPSLANQGMLAGARAAEILYTNCEEANSNGTLPEVIRCIDFGIGAGMFGLQLLNRFKELSEQNGKDYYTRLEWYATDESVEVLFEIEGYDTYEKHRDNVRLGRLDLLDPTRFILHETREEIDLASGFQGIFINYVLSALPAEVWCHQPDGEDPWQGAMVRLAIEDWEAFEPLCPFTPEALLSMAEEPTSENLDALSEIYTLLRPEFTLGAAEASEIPRLEALQEMSSELGTTESGTWLLDSAIAINAIEALIPSLNEDGFVLVRDFGPGNAEEANQSHCYRNFGPVTAFPVNFWQLDRHFSNSGTCSVSRTQTNEDAEPRSRLLSRRPLTETPQALEAAYGLARHTKLVDAIEAANTEAANPARYLDKIKEAIEIEPMNWTLISEAATYALNDVEDADEAVELAIRAVSMNPTHAAQAWKVLGDVKFWIHEDLDLAAEAFQNAIASNPTDPAAHLGLQQVFAARKDHAGALIAAAAAVAEDKDGLYQEHSLQVLKKSIDSLVNFQATTQEYQNQTFEHDS